MLIAYENVTFYVSEDNYSISISNTPYSDVLKKKPIQTYNDAAKAFVNLNKDSLEKINKAQLTEKSILVFTSDYALYWWDYQSGYDCILAQLGWNNSVAQEIGLVRGAANMQGKRWGIL